MNELDLEPYDIKKVKNISKRIRTHSVNMDDKSQSQNRARFASVNKKQNKDNSNLR